MVKAVSYLYCLHDFRAPCENVCEGAAFREVEGYDVVRSLILVARVLVMCVVFLFRVWGLDLQ